MLEEMTVQVTNEEQHILWEEYGLRLHIPHDVLPDGCKVCNLKIAVSLSGNFQLEDCVPVSGVYSFKHDLGDRKLRKPVTLEMQHCATSAVWSGLQFLRANHNSNKFTVVPGGIFLPDDHYGKIKLDNFSNLIIAFVRKLFSIFSSPSPIPTVSPCEYRAQLYYTDTACLSFQSNLYILQNLTINFKVCIIYLSLNLLFTFLSTYTNRQLRTTR